MFIWMIAVALLAGACVVGFYQGAIRGAFSFLGLLAATLVAMPLSVVTKPIFKIFGMEHPVLLDLFAPILAFVLVLILFKVGGFALHRKLSTFYRYHDSDTRRMLFERLNERLGICMGVPNATIYVLLICLVINVIGYFTIQIGTSEKDSWLLRTVNVLARQVEATGMNKAVAFLNPAPKAYYDGIDILGLIYRNPLLQKRLSTYPPFLPFSERSSFQNIAKDVKFQEFWQRQPPIAEFVADEHIQPMIRDLELYQELTGLVGKQLPDLETYLMTGTSPKYESETILGRWRFDSRASLARTRRLKPMGSAEIRYIRKLMAATMSDAMLTAYVDGSVVLKAPTGKLNGTWKSTATGKYRIKTTQGEIEATIESNRLQFSQDKIQAVFKKI